MRQVLAALALFFLMPGVAFAPPPPPPLPLPTIREPVDGYDLQTPWTLWNMWVESQKGSATEAVLSEPDTLPGETGSTEPIFEFRKYNDFGHFLTGEVRVYCKTARPRGRPPRTCHYRLRRAYVDHNVAGYGGASAVSRWTIDNFDAARLVRHFRDAGFAPDTDWWNADRTRLFVAMPSPIPVLMANTTVVRLDSRECPAFGRAVERLDRVALTTRLDMIGVGGDYKPTRYLQPHGGDVRYTVRAMAPGAGALMKIEGSGVSQFTKLFQPMLDAADACEAAREKSAR